jgi:hypothetical protein
MTTKNKERKKMKENEILIEEKKKPYQKPELVVHGSVEKITKQIPGNLKAEGSGTV